MEEQPVPHDFTPDRPTPAADTFYKLATEKTLPAHLEELAYELAGMSRAVEAEERREDQELSPTEITVMREFLLLHAEKLTAEGRESEVNGFNEFLDRQTELAERRVSQSKAIVIDEVPELPLVDVLMSPLEHKKGAALLIGSFVVPASSFVSLYLAEVFMVMWLNSVGIELVPKPFHETILTLELLGGSFAPLPIIYRIGMSYEHWAQGLIQRQQIHS